MNAALRIALLVTLLMLAASIASLALRPTVKMADIRTKSNLETMVPMQFGKWRLDPAIIPVAPSPDLQTRLDAIYDQILLRTYLDADGNRVMLLIAYGSDQRGDNSQVHRPEFCYYAQGFQLQKNASGNLQTGFGQLEVRRLVAVQGRRKEPITYWITVGDKATLPGLGRKFNQIAYGLGGKVPDGMLVRISTIDTNDQHGYLVQDAFIRDMLAAILPEERVRIAGKFGK